MGPGGLPQAQVIDKIFSHTGNSNFSIEEKYTSKRHLLNGGGHLA